VQQVLATGLEPRSTVGHDTLALCGTDLAAEVGLAGLAELALTALGGASYGVSWIFLGRFIAGTY
jgi:hypothetical protein